MFFDGEDTTDTDGGTAIPPVTTPEEKEGETTGEAM